MAGFEGLRVGCLDARWVSRFRGMVTQLSEDDKKKTLDRSLKSFSILWSLVQTL